jgi:hypothetical protein
MLPRRADGGLDPLSDFHQHAGSGPNPRRQERPHAHSINADPTNRYAFVCDLGLDRIVAYRLDLEGGKLVYDESRTVVARPGVGPRHLAWHPDGRHAFVLNELDGSVDAFAFDSTDCRLTRTSFAPGLPAGFAGDNTSAEVRVLPNGRFVYGSQRGHDSIAIWSFDERSGLLAHVGNRPSGGKTPRNFTIDATGRLMLVAHQDDDRVVAFHRPAHPHGLPLPQLGAALDVGEQEGDDARRGLHGVRPARGACCSGIAGGPDYHFVVPPNEVASPRPPWHHRWPVRAASATRPNPWEDSVSKLARSVSVAPSPGLAVASSSRHAGREMFERKLFQHVDVR